MAGAFWAGTDAAVALERLSGTMLREQLPGAQINLDTPLGSVIPITFGTDGTLEGRAGAVAFFLGAQKDRGKWWVEGSKLCQQWSTWFDGRKSCVRVYRTHGNRISWIDKDGDKGTGTIVSLRVVQKSEPPAPAKPTSSAVPAPAAAEARPRPAPPDPAAQVAPPRPTPARPASQSGVRTAKAEIAPARAPVPERKIGPPRSPVATPAAATRDARAAAPAPPPSASAPWSTSAKAVSSADAARLFRVVNVPQDDVLNVRSGPSPSADIVTTMAPRSRGVVMTGQCRGDWCRIRRGRDAGWVHRYFLAPEQGERDNGQAADPITYRVVRVESDDVLNIRSRPDPDARIVGSIPASGRRIRLTGYCAGEWCPVAYERRRGWVNRYYLTLEF